MKRQILTPDELSTAVSTLYGWAVDGTMLRKRYAFPNFAGALTFVNKVGELAEAVDHHPDITFGWGYAELALTTHDRGGITEVDISLAASIDRLETP